MKNLLVLASLCLLLSACAGNSFLPVENQNNETQQHMKGDNGVQIGVANGSTHFGPKTINGDIVQAPSDGPRWMAIAGGIAVVAAIVAASSSSDDGSIDGVTVGGGD